MSTPQGQAQQVGASSVPWGSLLSILITSTIVVIGWIAAHRFAAQRDRENKRREQRVNYLVSAFRTLLSTHQNPNLYHMAADIERAAMDIQLFGTEEQIKEAHRIIDEAKRTQIFDIETLLRMLRKELRNDLGLDPYDGPIAWVKIEKADHVSHDV